MKNLSPLIIFALLLFFAGPGAASALPDEALTILRHGPTGMARGQVQVRVDFSRPLIPLAPLSDAERRNILARFRLEPAVEGSFRFLGTSTVVFEPGTSLPMASRYTVTVEAGIRSVDGGVLAEPLSWTFTTPAINIWITPADGTGHVLLSPDAAIHSNVGLDAASLTGKVSFRPSGGGAPVAFTLTEDRENASPDEDTGMDRRSYRYHLVLEGSLERDTAYRISVAPGVVSLRGNLPTEKAYSARFRTYPPFRFGREGFCEGCGPHLRTRPFLGFTNKPDGGDFEEKVSISPAVEKWPFLMWGCDNLPFAVTVDDRLLEPERHYTVTLPPGLKDVYGQELENPRDVSFVTGALTPRLRGPSGYQVISPSLAPEFNLKTAGIPTVNYRLIPLQPRDILFQESLGDRNTIERLLDRLPGKMEKRVLEEGPGGTGRTLFDLRGLLAGGEFGAVAYTFLSPGVACFKTPRQLAGILLRTDLGLYTQFLPTGGRIKVNRLTDGSPVAGAEVRLYRSDDLPRLEKVRDRITGEGAAEPGEPCAAGTTGEDGILRLDAASMKACGTRRISNKVLNELYPPGADPDDILYDQERYGTAEPPRLSIVAEKGKDWTFLQTREYGVPSVWQFGVGAAWEGERPLPRGIIFSDRNIYRPGETIRMKGLSRYLLYGRMHTGAGSEYTVTVTDPRGREEELTKVKVSSFGTFSFDVPTKVGQPLGYYQVVARGAHNSLRFAGSFRLDEFRPPEFVVGLEMDRETAVAGETVRMAWDGRYYFGAPMQRAPSTLNIVRQETIFTPPGRERYRFGIPARLEDRRTYLGGQVSSEKIALDGEGRAVKELTVSGDELPLPMLYRAFAEVEDVSRQTAGADGRVVLLPDRRLAGVRLDRWIVQKGEKVSAEVIVTDPEGKALPGTPLSVKLLRREWHSIRRERSDGRMVTEQRQVVTEVEQRSVRSEEEGVAVTLTPPTAGSYMVRAELAEAPGSGTAAAAPLWAAGSDYVPWRGSGEDRLEIVFDKEEYALGDEAVALIRSPFRKADLYVTLCRDRIFSEEVISFEGSAFTYRFTVTEEMLPNAFLGAFLVNRGGPLVPVEEESGRHMEKVGFVPFRVEKTSRYLSVSVNPEKELYRPGSDVDITVKVTYQDKAGSRSELTVMVVDESVLALTGYRPPDLVKVVHADRGLSARVNDNRPFLISKAELLQKGHGHGGGMDEGPRVRRRFLRLAHYEPSLVTDDRGEASFRFTLPDNLTTFRVMVVAVGEEDRFGYGDDTITVTQPFLLRPVFPRYSRTGDSFLAGVGVTNLSGAEGKLDLRAEILDGKGFLRFALDDALVADVQAFTIREGESTSLLFPLNSLAAGEGRLRFTAFFSGTHEGEEVSESDSLETSHTVRDPGAAETVVAVGETLEEALEKIRIDDEVRPDTGGLEIMISSSALAGLGEGARYLVDYPYGCLEQTVSRLLALMELKTLSEKHGFTLDAVKPLEGVTDANIRKMLAMQNWDGGFRFWPTAELSSCWLSPYAARLFARMKEMGHQVPEKAAEELGSYLHKVLRNPCLPLGGWRTTAEYRIRVLTGLAWLGDGDQTWFEEYYSRRIDLSYGARIALASLLKKTPGWEGKARTMLGEIMDGLFVTAQTAHFEEPRELPRSWTFLSSPVITTAEGLRLLLSMDPESDLLPKMARYLLNARVNGRWRNTYENSSALDALIEFSLQREAEPPNFHAEVRLAGKVVMEEIFAGHSRSVKKSLVAIRDLPKGLSDIVVSKDGEGRLHYTLSYSYRLRGPRPARSEGFTVTRVVRDWETREEVALFGREAPPKATLESGKVYEVELEFRVPQTGYHFVLDDSLPAGLEPIDTSLRTTSGRYRPGMEEDDSRGYLGNPFNHKELRDDGAGLFADTVRPGLYRFRYLARATTAGTYLWPGARAHLMYEPEQFGTSAEGEVDVREE